MTCNQLILLLDCRRGFAAQAHRGSLYADIETLKNLGLINDEMELTGEGERVVEFHLQANIVRSRKTQLRILEREHAQAEVDVARILKAISSLKKTLN